MAEACARSHDAGSGPAHHAEADMEPWAVGVARPPVVGRITIGHAPVAVLILAVKPVAPAQAAVRLAVRHERTGERARRVGDDAVEHAIGVVVRRVPVIHPLPDVARHIV